MTTSEQKRKIRNFLANLRRNKNKTNKKREMLCRGGPFDGQKLLLDAYEPRSAVFTVKGQTGRYVCRNTDTPFLYLNSSDYLRWETR